MRRAPKGVGACFAEPEEPTAVPTAQPANAGFDSFGRPLRLCVAVQHVRKYLQIPYRHSNAYICVCLYVCRMLLHFPRLLHI